MPDNSKLEALGSTLERATTQFLDILEEFDRLRLNCEEYKREISTQKELLNRKCISCDELRESLNTKNNILESVGCAVTRLNETKNFNIIKQIFNILCQENNLLTPPKDSPKESPKSEQVKTEENDDITMISVDQSVSDIEGTPTGRTSPIIPQKKPKKASETIDSSKRKCSVTASTSTPKMVKLHIPLSSGRGVKKMRQTRFQFSKAKESRVVDLTSSPEIQSDGETSIFIKKEPVDIDNTILPSPTSGPVQLDFTSKLKQNLTSCNKSSPSIFKPSTAKLSLANKLKPSPKKNGNCQVDMDVVKMENSINLLNQNRYKNSPSKAKVQETRIKSEPQERNDENHNPADQDDDVTRIDESLSLFKPPQIKLKIKSPKESQTFTEKFNDNAANETNVSLSILKHVEILENEANKLSNRGYMSPSKVPLKENTCITNAPDRHPSDTQTSMSVIRGAPIDEACGTNNNKVKRITPEKLEPIYKEPTVRKKAEKRALPGWSCDECKNFYSELYKDNYDMLLKLMDECSRHRGKHNPARPKTPENYWNPRWDVPDDTETFNKRNNV